MPTDAAVLACLLKLLGAAHGVAPYLTLSTDTLTSDLLNRSPALAMREAADALEQRDAAIQKFRTVLRECETLETREPKAD